ncbi:hypothetical protein KJ611_03900 [Patescibacteria group bacterium]|nr:hypothetical protein [Patescibacteria group bacterium]MBU1705821.1 hypothetical protein [Patescibacteria group bacterium]
MDSFNKKPKKKQLSAADYLKANDSLNFFLQTRGHLKTGPTGVNVSDLLLALRRKT